MQNQISLTIGIAIFISGVLVQAQSSFDKMVFDRMLVYEQTDVNGAIVRYQILLNSQTGQFGFDKKLANLSLPGIGDGFTFATSQPDGSYRVYVLDPVEGKVVVRYMANRSLYSPGRTTICHQRFNQRFRSTGRVEKRNGLASSEYRTSLDRKDIEYLSLACVPFHTYPLYLFNELTLEAKLPDAHSLNFANILQPNELLTESKRVYYSETINGMPAVSTLKLIYYGPARYSFNTTGYQLR